MEKSSLRVTPFHYGIFLEAVSPSRKAYTLLGKYIIERVEFCLKEIKKEEITRLINAGIIKNTGRGFVNTKRNQPVGLVRTVHGRHYYIEDWYSYMAKKLN